MLVRATCWLLLPLCFCFFLKKLYFLWKISFVSFPSVIVSILLTVAESLMGFHFLVFFPIWHHHFYSFSQLETWWESCPSGCVYVVGAKAEKDAQIKSKKVFIQYDLSWCRILLSSSMFLLKWMLKFVFMIGINYIMCWAQFEMKIWVELPDFANKNKGHLAKFDWVFFQPYWGIIEK